MSDDVPQERFEDIRVISPDTGAVLFEIGQPWPQPDTHANLVRALLELESVKDVNVLVPKRFGGSRAAWQDDVEGRIKQLRDAVTDKVSKGEPKPSYAIIDAIRFDDDRIIVIGRPVGRWTEEQKSVSCDLPYSKFCVERRWYGAQILRDYVEELDEDDDEEEEAVVSGAPVSPAASGGAPAVNPDQCLACLSLLGGAAFCSKCGTPRGEEG